MRFSNQSTRDSIPQFYTRRRKSDVALRSVPTRPPLPLTQTLSPTLPPTTPPRMGKLLAAATRGRGDLFAKMSRVSEKNGFQRCVKQRGRCPGLICLGPYRARIGIVVRHTSNSVYRQFSPLRIVREITDVFSDPSPCPLPNGARVHRTVISRTILRSLGRSKFFRLRVIQNEIR